jgi:hypothetical protein
MYINRPTGLVHAVIDTDAYNEIDDQFAIAWLISSPKKVSVQALYAAPFFNGHSSSAADGMEKSYQEIKHLLTLANREEMLSRVYRGSECYLPDEKTPVESAAARNLAHLAAQYTPENPLYVLTIGAITNVASALLMAPAIAKNIVVVWLGGHAWHYHHNKEFNCYQDVAAARVVFDSEAPLVQLPCMGVVDQLRTTKPELMHWLGGKNALCDYLVNHTIEEAEAYAKGKPWSRVIWDISTVAWLLDSEKKAVLDLAQPRPIIQYDHHYSFSPDRPQMNYVYEIHRDKVFEEMFTCLAGK